MAANPDSLAHWRSAFRVASRPSRIMNRGMTATVTARITALNQSRTTMQARRTTGVRADRTRVGRYRAKYPSRASTPWVAEAASSPVRSPASHDGPRVTARVSSWRRRVEVTEAEVRWAATSPAHAAPARRAKAPARATSAGTVRARPACPIRTSWTIAPSRMAWATSAAVPTSPTVTAAIR